VVSGMQPVVNNTSLPGFFPATAMPDPDWWEALWPNPRGVLIAIGVRPGIEAIDLGCGDGLFIAQLALMAKHVFAIDIDPEMLMLTGGSLPPSVPRTAS
jgi:2-polyprenyl-3-methyl-5-hydroxy-6-metoxy-1,4-benzoquinol methylase